MKYRVEGNGAQFKVYIFDSERGTWFVLKTIIDYSECSGSRIFPDKEQLFNSLNEAKLAALTYIREKEDKWETVFEGET